VAAVQALDQAYRDYFGAISEANQAQFRLYRALGHPARCVLDGKDVGESPPTDVRFADLGAPLRPAVNTPVPNPLKSEAGSDFATSRRR
jgi:hypothetical protein